MDTTGIALIIAGIASIAVGILGKFRPDIVYRNWDKKTAFGGAFRLFGFAPFRLGGDKMTPENKQRFGFVVFVLFGIMMLLVAGVMSVPQWQGYMDAVIISIVMVMTVVMLFAFWKIVLSQDESIGRIGFAVVMLIAMLMIAVCIYYWIVTLK